MYIVQGGSNMTRIDLCVNKPHLVPVIFEPPSTIHNVTEDLETETQFHSTYTVRYSH